MSNRFTGLIFLVILSLSISDMQAKCIEKGQSDKPGCSSYLDDISKRRIFDLVDNMPSFPGRWEAILNFLIENINYPPHCISGTAYVSFIVESDGKLTNKELIKGIMDQADIEAIAVVSKMPQWNPGLCNGKIVPVKMTIPIRFTLD